MIPCSYTFWGTKRCRFEPRYSRRAPDPQKLPLMEVMSEEQIMALADETYVHDICVACGKVRSRNDQQEGPMYTYTAQPGEAKESTHK